MKAARIHRFGSPEVIVIDNLPQPVPGPGELLVRVRAAGVGPWDAIIREGKSQVSPRPPLTLGSDLSGIVEAIGPGVEDFRVGDAVFGVTNPQFCGAQAEYALASAAMLAPKPPALSHLEAASVPVVAVTAWQMLFEYAHAKAGETVLILGAAGNVGAYAVQLAAGAGLHVIAVAGSKDADALQEATVDVVIDTVGGSSRERAFQRVKPGGILVSVVSKDPMPDFPNVRSAFFYVDVTTARLTTISELLSKKKLATDVGAVLPLADVRSAHEMLAGAPHKRGKIVLTMDR
jgi:NADPH:quinone reductase-like Zn-dependent oxidoreductase